MKMYVIIHHVFVRGAQNAFRTTGRGFEQRAADSGKSCPGPVWPSSGHASVQFVGIGIFSTGCGATRRACSGRSRVRPGDAGLRFAGIYRTVTWSSSIARIVRNCHTHSPFALSCCETIILEDHGRRVQRNWLDSVWNPQFVEAYNGLTRSSKSGARESGASCPLDGQPVSETSSHTSYQCPWD